MKLVVEIPDEMYNQIKSGKDGYSNYVHTAIRNGSPLPKDNSNRIFADIDYANLPPCREDIPDFYRK